jgi:hypothetical protein
MASSRLDDWDEPPLRPVLKAHANRISLQPEEFRSGERSALGGEAEEVTGNLPRSVIHAQRFARVDRVRALMVEAGEGDQSRLPGVIGRCVSEQAKLSVKREIDPRRSREQLRIWRQRLAADEPTADDVGTELARDVLGPAVAVGLLAYPLGAPAAPGLAVEVPALESSRKPVLAPHAPTRKKGAKALARIAKSSHVAPECVLERFESRYVGSSLKPWTVGSRLLEEMSGPGGHVANTEAT